MLVVPASAGASSSWAAGLSVRIWVTGGGFSYIWLKYGIRIAAPMAIVTASIAIPFPNLLGDVRIMGSFSWSCESCELVTFPLPLFSDEAHAVHSHNTSLKCQTDPPCLLACPILHF